MFHDSLTDFDARYQVRVAITPIKDALHEFGSIFNGIFFGLLFTDLRSVQIGGELSDVLGTNTGHESQSSKAVFHIKYEYLANYNKFTCSIDTLQNYFMIY